MNFRAFVETTREGLLATATRLEGDRDVTPMLHLESAAGIRVEAVAPWFFESSPGTQLLVERFVIPLIRQDRARKLAWTFCAWVAPQDSEQRPSEHPERREVLLATFIDPEVVEHWAARITRTGGPVLIGDWIPSLPNVGGGPMITAIQEALR